MKKDGKQVLRIEPFYQEVSIKEFELSVFLYANDESGLFGWNYHKILEGELSNKKPIFRKFELNLQPLFGQPGIKTMILKIKKPYKDTSKAKKDFLALKEAIEEITDRYIEHMKDIKNTFDNLKNDNENDQKTP